MPGQVAINMASANSSSVAMAMLRHTSLEVMLGACLSFANKITSLVLPTMPFIQFVLIPVAAAYKRKSERERERDQIRVRHVFFVEHVA